MRSQSVPGSLRTQCFNRFLILTSVHPFSRADTTESSTAFVYANSHSTSLCIMSIENPELPNISMSTSALPAGKAGILPTCLDEYVLHFTGPQCRTLPRILSPRLIFPSLVLVHEGAVPITCSPGIFQADSSITRMNSAIFRVYKDSEVVHGEQNG